MNALADWNGRVACATVWLKREDIPSRNRRRQSVGAPEGPCGWGWDKQFAAIVSRREAEDRYVNSVLRIVERVTTPWANDPELARNAVVVRWAK